MKFYVNHQSFKKALQKVSRFSGKDVLPFGESIFFCKVNDHQVDIICTNLEVIGSITLDVEFEDHSDEESFAVTVKTLKNLLKVIKPGIDTGKVLVMAYTDTHGFEQVEIMGSGGYVNICCDSKEKVSQMKDFIYSELRKNNESDPIFTSGLFRAVNQVKFCASNDEARPMLQGVRINSSVAATDGFRIAKNPITFNGIDCIVPADVFIKARGLFGDEVIVKQNNKTIEFSDENTKVVSNLINGNFPDYDAIIPKSWLMKTVIYRSKLLEALALAQASQKEFGGNNVVKLTFHDTWRMILTTEVGASGSCACPINTTSTLNLEKEFTFPFKIAFNVRMLKEIVDHIDGESVVLKMTSNNTPLVVESADEGEHPVYVLMPMHLG